MNIILVDDDRGSLNALNTVVKLLGYQATAFDHPALALEHFAASKCDLAILDIAMPEMDGIELAKKFRMLEPDTRIILVSGFVCDKFEDAIAGTGSPISFLRKPLDAQRVQQAIDDAWGDISPDRRRGRFDLTML